MKHTLKLFSLISITLLFSFCIDRDEIKRYKRITAARIVGKDPTTNGGYMLMYSFVINNKKYKGRDPLILYNKFETSFKGKYLPVVYSRLNPENNLLLVTPEHYQKWGYEFPDSLSWVKNCLGVWE